MGTNVAATRHPNVRPRRKKNHRGEWRKSPSGIEGNTLHVKEVYGGRGLKSVENECNNIKIKAAVKLYCNAGPTMAAVRLFEE